MNHSFLPSKLTPTKCAHCDRGLLDHSKAAHCESCDYVGHCELNGDKMLVCPECYDKHIGALIDRTNESAKQTIERSQAIDNAIKSSNEFFNADTVSICELRDSIMADDSLPESMRANELHKVIRERVDKFQQFIFAINDNKVDDKSLMSFGENLRNLGENIRQEIRERIKANDDKYVITKPKAIKIPKIGEKKSPLDLIIERVALARGISKTEAMILVKDKGLM
jgi:hypothetical protein